MTGSLDSNYCLFWDGRLVCRVYLLEAQPKSELNKKFGFSLQMVFIVGVILAVKVCAD